MIFGKIHKKRIDIKKQFNLFYKRYPYLQIQELIEFFSLFSGLEDYALIPDEGIKENIIKIYLQNYDNLKDKFIYSNDNEIQKLIEFALKRLSRGDRKRLSIYKDLTQSEGKIVYKHLFDKGIIKEEISRERPFKTGRQPVKKELRRYIIDNKIHFVNESTRFWFNFIAPNANHIKNGDFKKVLEQIEQHLEKHISLCFELLSIELIKEYFSKHIIKSSGSFWYKKSEIDLLLVTQDNIIIVGESKWTSGRVCKNIYNNLVNKTKSVNILPTYIAFFSKSGFSKEMENINDKRVLLFTLEDFRRLLQ